MRAIITATEIVGKDKSWQKINFINVESGEAGNGLLPVAKFDKACKITLLGQDFENDVDIDFTSQGRIAQVKAMTPAA